MSYDPFAAVIAEAQAAQATEAAKKKAKAAEAARTNGASNAIKFGKGFLDAVARKVAKPTMKPGYLTMIKAYAEALLSPVDKTLPQINERHAAQIESIFAYGLVLAKQDGRPVADDHLFGQRLLTEQQAAKVAEAKRIVIKPGAKPQAPRAAVVHTTLSGDLPAAVTPAGTKGGRPTPASVPVKALVAV